jgi:hypothetical protein
MLHKYNTRHADCALAEPKALAPVFESRIQESTSAALKQQRNPVSNLEKQATALNSDPYKNPLRSDPRFTSVPNGEYIFFLSTSSVIA